MLIIVSRPEALSESKHTVRSLSLVRGRSRTLVSGPAGEANLVERTYQRALSESKHTVRSLNYGLF